MAKRALFGGSIEKACLYCQHGKLAADKLMILCRKFGPVSPHYKCRRFVYDPLKRVPVRTPVLPRYDENDFKL